MAYKKNKVISGVYTITHIPSGRIYVGSSNHIYKRWSTHKSALDNNRHENGYLQNAWNKYGSAQFRFEIVQVISGQELGQAEKQWMTKTNCLNRSKGFNIYPDPTGLERIPLSKEHKKKLSEIFRGRVFSEKHRQKLSEALKGKGKPQHVMEALRQANVGREWTEEQRAKRSILSSGSSNGKAKLNEQIVIDIKLDLIYGYQQSYIARKYKISKTTVGRIVKDETWKHVLPDTDILSKRNERLKEGKVCAKCNIWKEWPHYSRAKNCAYCKPCEKRYRTSLRLAKKLL